jgi:hypothetical protein
MFEFCPLCGQTIEQDQVAGRMLACGICGKDIGFVGAVQRAAGDEIEARIRAGIAARCPECQQAVDLKTSATGRTLVPHYGLSAPRKICPGSGKSIAAEPPAVATQPASKDLSKWMTRDVLKVLYAPKNAEPRIEVLTLEYLDKSERVRIQIEALREILGSDFRLCDYPASLHRPHLAVWASSEACVVAKRHQAGGFESISDADVLAVLADLRQHPAVFFG